MNYRERKYKLIDYATKGIIEALEHTRESSLGPCVVRVDLFPRAAIRSNALIFSDEDETIFDDLLPEITADYILNNWQLIRLHAARDYQKYVIPGREGVYLGSFEEYQKIPNERLASIASGLQDLADAIANICEEQGGSSIRIDVQVKQLPQGGNGNQPQQ